MSKLAYTVDYFIDKFTGIPEEKWCERQYRNGIGQRCALGHCGVEFEAQHTEESTELVRIFGGDHAVTDINNGAGWKYALIPHPKARILAALNEKLQTRGEK